MELLDPITVLLLMFEEPHKFSIEATTIYIPTNSILGFPFLHAFANIYLLFGAEALRKLGFSGVMGWQSALGCGWGLRAWGCTTSVLVVIFPTVCSFVRDWFGAEGVMPYYSSGFASSQVYAGMPALTRGFCPGA